MNFFTQDTLPDPLYYEFPYILNCRVIIYVRNMIGVISVKPVAVWTVEATAFLQVDRHAIMDAQRPKDRLVIQDLTVLHDVLLADGDSDLFEDAFLDVDDLCVMLQIEIDLVSFEEFYLELEAAAAPLSDWDFLHCGLFDLQHSKRII